MYLNSECVAETYNCEDFKDSGSTQGLRFYARSNINDLGTETCVQGYQTTFLLIFWEDQTIAGAPSTCVKLIVVSINGFTRLFQCFWCLNKFLSRFRCGATDCRVL